MYTKPLIILTFLLLPLLTNAETHISNENILSNLVWEKEGNPYILDEPVYIPSGRTLLIKEGVEVRSSPPLNEGDSPNSISGDGELKVIGTKDLPVKFVDMYSISFSNTRVSVEYADLLGTGFDFLKSNVIFKNVTIQNAWNAVSSRASNVYVSSSTIANNNYGIFSYKHEPIFQVLNTKDEYGIGGEGDIDLTNLDTSQNIIKIVDSNLVDNTNFSIINQTTNPVDARENWWGGNDGPQEGKISGLVNVSPWITQTEIKTCCSNILFIPGLQASRLYRDEKGLQSTNVNRLWEPNINLDVNRIMMDSTGKSIDPNVYTKDIIESAYGIKSIYKKLVASLNTLVNEEKIKEWKPVAYDWRKSPIDIVDQALIETASDLALNSKTGKINIIAHSNGGQVTKVLVKKLEEKGMANIIDKIVFVAVPELGTPQAILAMLHGYNQSIMAGLFMDENTSRIFSQNLPGAYGLLPSKKFYDKSNSSVITDMFTNNTRKDISNYEMVREFLTSNPFSKIFTPDLNIPLLLNSHIISTLEPFHSVFDDWKPATTSVKVHTIIGWGLPTSNKITYEKDRHCGILQLFKCKVIFLPGITNEGDGTVVTQSRSGNSDTLSFFNLKDLELDVGGGISHANIFESVALLSKMEDIVTDSEDASYQKYFTNEAPTDSNEYLTIKIYSPVDIDVYDKKGNHTGPIKNPTPDRNLFTYENKIPLSYYGDFAGTKLLRVPYGDEYRIELTGKDRGMFSIDVEISKQEKVIASTTFTGLPATPLMKATIVIATSTKELASSTLLNLDINGDGKSDIEYHSDEVLKRKKESQAYIEMMKKKILFLKLPFLLEKLWLSRLDQLKVFIRDRILDN